MNEVDSDGMPVELPEVDSDGMPIELPANPLLEVEELEIDEKLQNVEANEHDQNQAETRIRRLPTILNLINSLLGAGILGVPSAMKFCGLVPSIIMLLAIAGLSEFATILLIKLQKKTNAKGLDDLTSIILGKFGSIALSISILIFLMSALVCYLVIASDSIISLARLLGYSIVGWKRYVLVFVHSFVVRFY